MLNMDNASPKWLYDLIHWLQKIYNKSTVYYFDIFWFLGNLIIQKLFTLWDEIETWCKCGNHQGYNYPILFHAFTEDNCKNMFINFLASSYIGRVLCTSPKLCANKGYVRSGCNRNIALMALHLTKTPCQFGVHFLIP